MIGFILLVIPGIYLWGILQFCFLAIVVDNAGAFESFSISSGLVKGYWWRSATIGFVAFVLVMVFSFIASFISGFLAVFVKDPMVSFAIQQIISIQVRWCNTCSLLCKSPGW